MRWIVGLLLTALPLRQIAWIPLKIVQANVVQEDFFTFVWI